MGTLVSLTWCYCLSGIEIWGFGFPSCVNNLSSMVQGIVKLTDSGYEGNQNIFFFYKRQIHYAHSSVIVWIIQ